MSEEWRNVLGYEGLYLVSNIGRVKSIIPHNGTKERIMKFAVQRIIGHYYVQLKRRKQKSAKKYVHALVLEAFVGPRPLGMESLHNDGNPKNNIVSNLRWGTHKENAQDSILHGTFFIAKGEQHGNSVLTESIVREMRCRLKQGEKASCLAKIFNCSESQMTNIKHYRHWKHVI